MISIIGELCYRLLFYVTYTKDLLVYIDDVVYSGFELSNSDCYKVQNYE